MITDGSQITDLKGGYIKASDDKKEDLKKSVISKYGFTGTKTEWANANLRNTPLNDGKMVLKPKNINEKYKELEEIKKLKQEVKELKEKEKTAQMNVEELNAQINSDSKKNKRTMEELDKAYNEWLAINSEYKKKWEEYNKKKTEIKKKYQQRKKKGTKKVVLNNANKIKKQEKEEKQNGLPPDVAAMRRDLEFIKDQMAQQKNLEKIEDLKKTIIIPRNFPCNIYGQPMIQTNVDYYDITQKKINEGPAQISKQSINEISEKKEKQGYFR